MPHQQIRNQNIASSDEQPLLPGGLSKPIPAISSPRVPPLNYTGTATKPVSTLDMAKDIPHRPTTIVPTNKAGGSSAQSRKPSQTAAKPLVTRVVPSAAVASQNATSAAPPKKGSYKEIMARAQALKAQQSDIMQIKHKPVAKMSKKERQANDAEVAERARQEVRSAKSNKPLVTPARASPALDKRVPEPQEKKRKPLDLGYSGTMRGQPVAAAKPAAPSSKTAAVSRPTRGKSASRPRPGGGRYTYASYSDEEEDEEDDYDSESDMEAGGLDELEREEMESLRVAKEEDARALREEQEHDRLKRERRRKLEQLAAARKK